MSYTSCHMHLSEKQVNIVWRYNCIMDEFSSNLFLLDPTLPHQEALHLSHLFHLVPPSRKTSCNQKFAAKPSQISHLPVYRVVLFAAVQHLSVALFSSVPSLLYVLFLQLF